MRSVQIQKVMGVDKQVAQVFHFRFKLLWGHRENADKLEEVEKKGLADFEKVIGVVQWLRRVRR